MDKIAKLQQEKNDAVRRCMVLVDAGLKTPEQRTEHAKLTTRMDEIESDLLALRQIETHFAKQPAPIVAPSPKVEVIASPSEERAQRSRVNAAWSSWILGEADQRIPEVRDILKSTSNGAALVPHEMSDFLQVAQKWYAPLTQYARTRISPNGRAVQVAQVDDRNNGLFLLTEGSAPPETDPTAFSSSLVATDLLSSGTVKASVQLFQDSNFDLNSVLEGLFASRIGRGLERILTTGADFGSTTTPNNPGLISIASTAVTTSNLASGIGWANVVAVFNGLDPAFLPRAMWQMSSATRNYFAGLEDSTARPYFVPAPNMGGLDMLLGKPVVINESLGAVGTANAVPVIFGSLYEGLEVISSEVRLTSISERFADTFERGLIASIQVGSSALAPGALQKIVLAAS